MESKLPLNTSLSSLLVGAPKSPFRPPAKAIPGCLFVSRLAAAAADDCSVDELTGKGMLRCNSCVGVEHSVSAIGLLSQHNLPLKTT
jgi:hypothetical protein